MRSLFKKIQPKIILKACEGLWEGFFQKKKAFQLQVE